MYLSTHAGCPPLELFVRVRGTDCTAETVALYDCLARLVSLSLQYGAPVETVGALLQGVHVEPCGIVTGHPAIHFCSSLPDLIGRHLLIEYCGRHEMGHSKHAPSTGEGEYA